MKFHPTGGCSVDGVKTQHACYLRRPSPRFGSTLPREGVYECSPAESEMRSDVTKRDDVVISIHLFENRLIISARHCRGDTKQLRFPSRQLKPTLFPHSSSVISVPSVFSFLMECYTTYFRQTL